MRLALISDIHGNLEALETVLKDIRAQGVDDVFCLGDVIGFGPNPRECVDLIVETCRVILAGESDCDAPALLAGLDFAAELPRSHRMPSFLFVHGSPRNPLSEYIFPEDVYNHRKMERLFQLVEHYCFQGHTHLPGIFTQGFRFFTPEEIDGAYTLGEEKLLINVGSVGQPRDGDPRACYLILDHDDGARPPEVTYRRIPYDYKETIRKIRERG